MIIRSVWSGLWFDDANACWLCAAFNSCKNMSCVTSGTEDLSASELHVTAEEQPQQIVVESSPNLNRSV